MILARGGRIGPNVIRQTADELVARYGHQDAARTLEAGTGRTFATLPREMVDEREANALIHAVVRAHGLAEARAALFAAGRRTGDYLLGNRIPRLARRLLPLLPRRLALRILLRAIGRHTWTFAGGADVAIAAGWPATIRIRHCPMCAGLESSEPSCEFYRGTFVRLLEVLVAADAEVRETTCEARGDDACRFVLGGRSR